MKFIFVPLILNFLLLFGSKLKKDNNLDKDNLINPEDRIDGRYRVLEKTNLANGQPMEEQWIAADELNQNQLVILKFYKKKESENTLKAISNNTDISSLDYNSGGIDLWRRADDFFTASIEECKQLKIIKYRIPQTLPHIRFDECLTPNITKPIGNEKAVLDSNNQTAIRIERELSNYISTPFYNVLTKPKGINLYDLCIIQVCKSLIRTISRGLILGLVILASDRECFIHGNLKLLNLYWLFTRQRLTISNMQFNKYPQSLIVNSAPWSGDMVSIAILLGQILTKNMDFKFKGANIRSALDLFLKVNENENFEPIVVDIIPKVLPSSIVRSKKGIFSRVVADFNEESRFLQKEKKLSMIDVDLGVPPGFNPKDQNFDKEQLNKMLENSIYDFLMRLVGKTYDKSINYEQFSTPDAALEHPFVSQNMETRLLPSDLR